MVLFSGDSVIDLIFSFAIIISLFVLFQVFLFIMWRRVYISRKNVIPLFKKLIVPLREGMGKQEETIRDLKKSIEQKETILKEREAGPDEKEFRELQELTLQQEETIEKQKKSISELETLIPGENDGENEVAIRKIKRLEEDLETMKQEKIELLTMIERLQKESETEISIPDNVAEMMEENIEIPENSETEEENETEKTDENSKEVEESTSFENEENNDFSGIGQSILEEVDETVVENKNDAEEDDSKNKTMEKKNSSEEVNDDEIISQKDLDSIFESEE